MNIFRNSFIVVLSIVVVCITVSCGKMEMNSIFHTHEYQEKAEVESTCVEAGEHIYMCECGEEYSEKISEIPHVLGEDNVCEMCRQKCVKYTYGDTEYVGPENTDQDYVVVNFVDSSGKTRIYKIHYQKKGSFENYSDFLDLHGCAISSLTSVLNVEIPEFEHYTPDMVIPKVEENVLGKKLFEYNYSKAVEQQMPITMFGISKVLEEYGIEHEYVYEFTEEAAEEDIKSNLESGKPVIIITGKGEDGKWAEFCHVMLLIGLNDDGEAIICDTMNKEWAGETQRIKCAPVEELVSYMWSSEQEPEDLYWGGAGGRNGYILLEE